MTQPKFILSLASLRSDEHAIQQPWIDALREELATSNVVNIYGPTRHGKTSATAVLLRQLSQGETDYPIDLRLTDTNLPISYMIARAILHNLGIEQFPPKDFSPSEMANFVFEAIDAKKQSSGTNIVLGIDETCAVAGHIDAAAFLATFIHSAKIRDDFKLILVSHYPLAAYPILTNIDIPEICVSKWSREKLYEYYSVYEPDYLKTEEQFNTIYQAGGGNPDIVYNVLRNNISPEIAVGEYADANISMLRGAAEEEKAHALNMLIHIAQGETIVPNDAFSQAAAIHLLTTGLVTETSEGALTSAGTGYDSYILEAHKVGALEMKTSLTSKVCLRLEPLMAKRGGSSARPKVVTELWDSFPNDRR